MGYCVSMKSLSDISHHISDDISTPVSAWPESEQARLLKSLIPSVIMMLHHVGFKRLRGRLIAQIKCLAEEIYACERHFFERVVLGLLRRTPAWQARVRRDLGGDKVMDRWQVRYDKRFDFVPARDEAVDPYAWSDESDVSQSIRPRTDKDGLFRLAAIHCPNRETSVPRPSMPSPYSRLVPDMARFRAIEVTPTDISGATYDDAPDAEVRAAIEYLIVTGRTDAAQLYEWHSHHYQAFHGLYRHPALSRIPNPQQLYDLLE